MIGWVCSVRFGLNQKIGFVRSDCMALVILCDKSLETVTNLPKYYLFNVFCIYPVFIFELLNEDFIVISCLLYSNHFSLLLISGVDYTHLFPDFKLGSNRCCRQFAWKWLCKLCLCDHFCKTIFWQLVLTAKTFSILKQWVLFVRTCIANLGKLWLLSTSYSNILCYNNCAKSVINNQSSNQQHVLNL